MNPDQKFPTAARQRLHKQPRRDSGISVDFGPKLRQGFKNNSQCTLYQNSVFSATFNPRPSTIRTTTPSDAPQQCALCPHS